MPVVGEWARRIWYLLNRRRFEEALRRDIEAHRATMGEPARFGNVLRLREESRDVWGWAWLDALSQDLRSAWRSLGQAKAFTFTSLVTLGLGIGATTAVFSVVSGLVFKPLPFADPDRLVQLYETSALMPERDAVAYLDAYRRGSRSLASMAGYEVSAGYLRDGGGVERVMIVRAEREFFSMLGVAPVRGRTFVEGDSAAAAVVSAQFWKGRLDGDGSPLGRTIFLDDRPFTIVGVMPEAFQFPYRAASLLPGAAAETRTDVWIPLDPPPRPGRRIGNVTARLMPGISISAAEAELRAIAGRMPTSAAAASSPRGVRLEALSSAVIPNSTRRVLFLLLAAVALVLALACANVVNLSLARTTIRSRELAVRLALGAGPARLLRQFLAESVVLAAAGGLLGSFIAWSAAARLLRAAAAYVPRAHEVGVDWRVFAFLAATCIVTTVAVGLAPAIMASRKDARLILQGTATPATMTLHERRVRDALVVVEVALAFVLAVGAAMLIRELARLGRVDTGMVTDGVVTVHVGHRRTPDTDARQFYDIAERVRQLPGVQAAGFVQMLPLQNWGWTSNSSDFTARGRPAVMPVFPIELRYITPGYFDALGIRVRRGRSFTTADDGDAPPVIIINETLSRRSFPGEDPIGLSTNRGTIVGVIGDVRAVHLDRSAVPEIYFPVAQNWSQVSELGMTLVARAQGQPEALAASIRSIVQRVNPNFAVFGVRTMEMVIAESLSEFTLYLRLITSFAALGLALAMTGAYGVTSYVTTSRTREFAIRIALGADKARVTGFVLQSGVRTALVGLAFGLTAVEMMVAGLRGLPVTVRPPDVATLAPVAGVLLVIVLLASLLPARRAASADPLAALRRE